MAVFCIIIIIIIIIIIRNINPKWKLVTFSGQVVSLCLCVCVCVCLSLCFPVFV